ncbi:MAG: ATP-binding protein [Flectobacillus sp.]|uniref:PAS domain-containing sensor histidine kinase n=1 Tax=Flectobacillus sp. TaxID=50419 RepID=UPI003B9C431A
MLLKKYTNWQFNTLNPADLAEFEADRLSFQSRAIVFALKIGIFLMPLLTISDIFALKDILSTKAWKGYLVGLLTIELLFILYHQQITKLIPQKEKISTLKVWITLAVLTLTVMQYGTSFMAKHYGAELSMIALAISYFNLSFMLNAKERFYYNLICLVFFFLGYLTIFPKAYILIDTMLVAVGLSVSLYFAGDIIYKLQLEKFAQNRLLLNKTQEQNVQLKRAIRNQKDILEVLCNEMGVSTEALDFDNADALGYQTKALLLRFAEYKQQILESKERYQDLFMNMNDGVAILSEKGVVKEANDTFLQILGVGREEMTSYSLGRLVHPDDREHSNSYLQKLLTEGFYKNYVGRIIRGDGEIRYLEVNSTAIVENGEFKGSRDIIRDITHRKLAEQALEEARNAEKQFLSTMSHEIRTPLNAIIGITHLLYDTHPNPQQVEYFDILKNSSQFLLNLITDLLDFAKMDAGKITAHPKDFDLKGLLKTIQQTFQMKVTPKGLDVDFMADMRMDQFYHADETLIYQVLFNLLGNADKFTEKGKIGLKVKILERNEEDTLFEFQVFDTGMGIPADKIDLIFNKFTQIHDKNKIKTPGTGLGLSISKQIVEFLGGKIWVESVEGKGTKFFFTLRLPKAVSANGLATEEPLALTETKKASEPSSVLEGFKILLVEDNELNRKYATTLLKKWKIDYDMAFDGAEACQKALDKKYDLILMDIQMPIMDGYEATIKITNTENPNKNTPIVALTASALVSQKDKALECGMADYLSKPFTPVQLKSILNKFAIM